MPSVGWGLGLGEEGKWQPWCSEGILEERLSLILRRSGVCVCLLQLCRFLGCLWPNAPSSQLPGFGSCSSCITNSNKVAMGCLVASWSRWALHCHLQAKYWCAPFTAVKITICDEWQCEMQGQVWVTSCRHTSTSFTISMQLCECRVLCLYCWAWDTNLGFASCSKSDFILAPRTVCAMLMMFPHRWSHLLRGGCWTEQVWIQHIGR